MVAQKDREVQLRQPERQSVLLAVDEDGVRHSYPIRMDRSLEGMGEQMVQVSSLTLPYFVERLLLINAVQLGQIVV